MIVVVIVYWLVVIGKMIRLVRHVTPVWNNKNTISKALLWDRHNSFNIQVYSYIYLQLTEETIIYLIKNVPINANAKAGGNSQAILYETKFWKEKIFGKFYPICQNFLVQLKNWYQKIKLWRVFTNILSTNYCW